MARPGDKLYGRLSVNVNMCMSFPSWSRNGGLPHIANRHGSAGSTTKHIMKVGKQKYALAMYFASGLEGTQD